MGRTTAARAAGRTATVVGLSTLLGLTLAAAPAALAVPAPAPASTAPAPAPAARTGDDPRNPAEDLLERPARGETAIDRLGDRLPEVARLNDLSRRGLSTLLEEDSSAWVATDGRVFFRDPAPAPAAVAAEPEPEASAPLAQTLALHSRPGAARTIFLDVDGATVSGTAWNDADRIGTSHPAWDPAGDGPGFTDAELTTVQAVWEMVAADFAAFDVDVTTEDPISAGLRSDYGDTTYGARVLITPSADAWERICGRTCGGVAYISVFDDVGTSPYQPAWVFTEALHDSAKSVADAASHEVGHQLGLQHDGKGGKIYYEGHGSWGPIMGKSYSQVISQWSRGDYAGATNQQDDVSVIAEYLPRVADEAGEGVAGSTAPPEDEAYITSRNDVDTYALGECSGAVVVEATTAALGPDLDLGLTLLDAEGEVVATADQPSAKIDKSRASGMDASLVTDVAPGTYHVSVDGTGHGTVDTGYDDYASIGRYALSVAGCAATSTAGAPSAPQDAAAAPAADEPEVTLTWSAPVDRGDSEVTGYTVTRSGSATPTVLTPETRSHTFGDLEPGTDYTFTVRARNASGAGPNATVSTTTVAPPGAARSLAGSWNAAAGGVRLAWRPPAHDGGDAISTYRFTIDGKHPVSVPGSSRAAVATGVGPGKHTVAVRAVNSAGVGVAATADVTVPPLSTRAWTGRSVSGRTVTLRTIVSLPGGDTDGAGRPTGTVTFSESGEAVGSATLEPLDADRAIARLVLRRVRPGSHTYRGAYSPDDVVRLAASADDATAVQVARISSRTSLRAPFRARARTRPVVRVRVDGGDETALGRVRLVVRSLSGRTSARVVTPRLRNETVWFRLPRLRPGRVRIVAHYRGSAVHLPSTVGRTIRVRR